MKGYVRATQRFITLIEIMIVMFLIALITGVVAYNYRGSLDEGRAFQTERAMEKIANILELEMAKQGTNPSEISGGDAWLDIVKKSPLVSNASDLAKDGWGRPFKVSVNRNGDIEITSDGLEGYKGGGKGTRTFSTGGKS